MSLAVFCFCLFVFLGKIVSAFACYATRLDAVQRLEQKKHKLTRGLLSCSGDSRQQSTFNTQSQTLSLGLEPTIAVSSTNLHRSKVTKKPSFGFCRNNKVDSVGKTFENGFLKSL